MIYRIYIFKFLSVLSFACSIACTTRRQPILPIRERLTETKRTPQRLAPRLTNAKYRVVWVPDKIEGDEYIEGHRVYVIEEQGKWVSP